MNRYVFTHDSDTENPRAFIVRARNKEEAIKKFIGKVRGRFGFFKKLRRCDILEDLSFMNLTIRRVTEVRR